LRCRDKTPGKTERAVIFVILSATAVFTISGSTITRVPFAYAQENPEESSGLPPPSSPSSSQTASTVTCNPFDSNPPAACLHPNSEGSCPSGTMNVHGSCATPASEDVHNAKVAKGLHLLASIVPEKEGGKFYDSVLSLFEHAPGACELELGQSCTDLSNTASTPTPQSTTTTPKPK
jgi:hypothetical protein